MEEALALAQQLPLSARLRLVESDVASVGQVMSDTAPDELRSEEH
jgi:hypothetical protein